MISSRVLGIAHRCLTVAAGVAALAARAPAARAQEPADRPDPVLVARLHAEATERSQVMETLSWLTDVYGPRLTGSPALRAAASWAVSAMRGWGLARAGLEPWGPFGRGWSNEGFALAVVAPQRYPVVAYPGAWTPGTPGLVRAEAVLVEADSAPALARYRGRLRGRLVLLGAPRELAPSYAPQAVRYSDAALDSIAALPAPVPRPALTAAERFARLPADVRREVAFAPARARFFAEEGVAGVLLQGRGSDGTVFVSSEGGSREAGAGPRFPTVVVAAEHYGRIARTIGRGVPVTLELTADNRFHDADPDSFNVVADLPGSDPSLRDEVVMLGAHLDSWHAGTGATDNAAGVAVMLEAMRVLRAARVPLRRTVRVALWTGEEQGLLGSRAYVQRHLGGRDGAPATAAHARLSAYFNLDNGTGKIRGIYQQGNAAVGPIFGAWMAPFRDGGMRTLAIASTTGTDHLSFDAVGIPGFQFIQDPVEYGTRTHHSNADVYERAQPDDLRWNATVVAAFAMQAANRAGRLPRRAAERADR